MATEPTSPKSRTFQGLWERQGPLYSTHVALLSLKEPGSFYYANLRQQSLRATFWMNFTNTGSLTDRRHCPLNHLHTFSFAPTDGLNNIAFSEFCDSFTHLMAEKETRGRGHGNLYKDFRAEAHLSISERKRKHFNFDPPQGLTEMDYVTMHWCRDVSKREISPPVPTQGKEVLAFLFLETFKHKRPLTK